MHNTGDLTLPIRIIKNKNKAIIKIYGKYMYAIYTPLRSNKKNK